ncbi:MAG: 4-hydroxy-tetrahydrodipicolinate synthase, partial [Polyangiaceae bacterium]
MSRFSLSGTFTALVTPFTADGEAVDLPALDALVEAQIQGGVSGLVPCGTTGESPTLSDEEQAQVIARGVAVAKGRLPVFAGTGTFSTKKTIEASRAAVAAGADAVMVVMPYYNKPSQDGMREHVLAIARAVDCPVVLYNIPGRSVVDLSAETTERICQAAPNVVGLKDATGNVLRCQELVSRLGARLTVMSGDDGLTVPMMAVGARGVISVSANVRPAATSAVTTAMLAGDLETARARHFALLDLHRAMFLEPNPAPAKAALAHEGKMQATLRLPLVPVSDGVRRQVIEALQRADAAAAAEGATRAAPG